MLEHRLAQITAAATFLLLLIGGTVNPTGSSLACPEPTLICHGEIFPPMVGGVLYEHGHRLAGMVVGLLQIALTVALLRRRPGLRRWAIGLLVMVCAQGSLGAITVYYKLPWPVSLAHLCVAMLYFASLIYVAWRTQPRGADGAGRGGQRADVPADVPADLAADLAANLAANLARARAWAALAACAVLAQIALGGLVRHLHGFLACLDLPLCHGRVLAPLDAPVALQLHLLHRVFGVVVGLVVIAAATAVFVRARGHRRLQVLALLAPALVAAQITLGVLTIWTVRAVPIAVAHFGGAALLWGLWVAIWLGTRPLPAEAASEREGGGVRAPDTGAREVASP